MSTIEIKKIEFNESRGLYLFLLVISIFALIGVSIFTYMLDVSIIGIFGNIMLFFYIYLVISKKLYKSFDNRIHILLLLVALSSITEYIVNKDIVIIMTLLFTIVIQLITSVPLSSYAYTINLEHHLLNGNQDLLIMKFNKLFYTAILKYEIPKNEVLRFVAEINPGFFKSRMFHKLILVNSKINIEIAPISANGFNVVNKIYDLFAPYPLIVTNIPRTNNKLTLPEMKKAEITIPKSGLFENHIPVEKLPDIINSDNFNKVLPKNFISYIITLLFAVVTFGMGISLYLITIQSLRGIIEKIPFDSMIMLIVLGTILIIFGFLFLISLLTVVLGKLQIDINDKVIITYTFLFRQIKVPIHRAFNPQVRINNNLLELIIYGDHMETIYLHKLGKLKSISEIHDN